MEKIRLYTEEALLEGVNLVLNPQQSHYACNVMRLKKLDNIFLFNGKDVEWLGEISDISRKSVEVRLKKCIQQQTV